MLREQIQFLFTYSMETSQRLLEQAAWLDESVYYANPGPNERSIHELFFHLLIATQGWRIAIETGTQPQAPPAEKYATLAALRDAYAREEAGWQAILDGLTDEEIDGPVTLTAAWGERAELFYWRIFQHQILHAMQHHTEIAQLLTRAGHSPGDIDFIFYDG